MKIFFYGELKNVGVLTDTEINFENNPTRLSPYRKYNVIYWFYQYLITVIQSSNPIKNYLLL